eukprot:scaffold306227_cov17-Prasinocladus_malaysianus.AAC.1
MEDINASFNKNGCMVQLGRHALLRREFFQLLLEEMELTKQTLQLILQRQAEAAKRQYHGRQQE